MYVCIYIYIVGEAGGEERVFSDNRAPVNVV